MSYCVWQISGGPAMRAYASVFLRHGVGLPHVCRSPRLRADCLCQFDPAQVLGAQPVQPNQTELESQVVNAPADLASVER